MPFVKGPNGTYKSPSGRTFTSKQVKMYYATKGFTKKKYKIKVNNKMKGALGAMDPKTNEVFINVKKHKGDKKELASTIKHELMHIKHPKMTEKQVYKRTAKTKISPQEQSKLLAKLRHKKLNYKVGAIKRKLKFKKDEKVETGSLIRKANLSRQKLAIYGLI